MCATGNFAVHGNVKDLRAEWAAAGPFLITLWTCREDQLRTLPEFVGFSKRKQESTILVCADQKFFQA